MSWFLLKDQKVHLKIKGIWLRPTSNPDVLKKIQATKLMRRSDVVKWIEIKEIRDNNEVLLEVWCSNLADMLLKKRRSNVFHVLMKENPEWVCEGDLGRGLK
jgi:hypothetical protein